MINSFFLLPAGARDGLAVHAGQSGVVNCTHSIYSPRTRALTGAFAFRNHSVTGET